MGQPVVVDSTYTSVSNMIKYELLSFIKQFIFNIR